MNGSPYEMGYQHGYLLKDQIEENLRILIDFFNYYDTTYSDLEKIWNVMKKNIPDKYLNEMKGVANGSSLSLDEIGVLNIIHDTTNLVLCCGAIVWGDATVDGKLIHVRSGDFSIYLE